MFNFHLKPMSFPEMGAVCCHMRETLTDTSGSGVGNSNNNTVPLAKHAEHAQTATDVFVF